MTKHPMARVHLTVSSLYLQRSLKSGWAQVSSTCLVCIDFTSPLVSIDSTSLLVSIDSTSPYTYVSPEEIKFAKVLTLVELLRLLHLPFAATRHLPFSSRGREPARQCGDKALRRLHVDAPAGGELRAPACQPYTLLYCSW